MGSTCTTDTRYARCYARFYFEKHARKKNHMGHLGADGWLIFKKV
jgi:hypothetical protein